MATLRLDGESEDGDVAIPMGKIASIERHGRRACEVVLKDGRSLRLRGTNDVNESNRGIMVEDPHYGRVVVFWDEFDKLEFQGSPESGMAYGDYKALGALKGTVLDSRGETHSGRIVFDLDEESSWEILNGDARDIEYNIPFHRIRSIEPKGDDETLVILRNGEEIYLEEGQDVTGKNDGVLIFAGGDDSDGVPSFSSLREFDCRSLGTTLRRGDDGIGSPGLSTPPAARCPRRLAAPCPCSRAEGRGIPSAARS